jgi:hypothetical protein
MFGSCDTGHAKKRDNTSFREMVDNISIHIIFHIFHFDEAREKSKSSIDLAPVTLITIAVSGMAVIAVIIAIGIGKLEKILANYCLKD